jgi:hypothetical protein
VALERLASLSDAFARALGDGVSSSTLREPVLVGLEHEYSLFEDERQVAFADILRARPPGPAHLNPDDPNAFWLGGGFQVTADGREAELATPPLALGPAFTERLARRADAGATLLDAVLPRSVRRVGYSTHLSISTPAVVADEVAWLFVGRFAPGLMLLMDRAWSPGLLIRPRPGRTELCAEFARGKTLRAAAAFAAGSVQACIAAATGEPTQVPLPPEISARIEPAVARYGWYFDRGAVGQDLLREGRATMLRTLNGASMTAQEHLERAWCAARHALDGAATTSDFLWAQRMVSGQIPLPIDDAHNESESAAVSSTQVPAAGGMLRSQVRPRFALAPVMVTWDVVVFVCAANGGLRRAFACVPRAHATTFLRALTLGRLDELLLDYLTAEPRDRRLETREQTRRPGLYDILGLRRDLLPPERDAMTAFRPSG